MVQVTQLTRT